MAMPSKIVLKNNREKQGQVDKLYFCRFKFIGQSKFNLINNG